MTLQDQQFDLDLWPCDLNILLASIVWSLGTFQYRGQEILSGQHLFKDQQFDLDLWIQNQLWVTFSIPRGIHGTKFGNFQAKGSKDIDNLSIYVEIDENHTKEIKCFFFLQVNHVRLYYNLNRVLIFDLRERSRTNNWWQFSTVCNM